MEKIPAPKTGVNVEYRLFDEQATGLLRKWLSVSESQICSLEVLCTQIPEVSKLLETSICNISERFVAIADDFDRYSQCVKQSIGLDGKRSGDIDEFHRNISDAISSIIVDMQFQDRVSQNMVIVTNVLNAIIGYVQEEINETITNLNERNERVELDKAFAQKLLTFFTLGELQHKFVDHLLTRHYINDYTELGYDPSAHPDKKERDNINLF